MNKEPLEDDLLIRYLEKETNPQEDIAVTQWISASETNKAYFSELTLFWKSSNFQKDVHAIDVKGDWKKVAARITAIREKKKTRKLIPTKIWKVAAGFALLIALSIYQYNRSQWVTLATTTEIKQFELPDGSIVWLNKNSKISYKKAFTSQSRNVLLEGEGYFEVHKDPEKPFIVQLHNTKTTVLGTQFNLKTHLDTSVGLVLVAGSVQFSTQQEQLLVAPGERIQANLEGHLLKTKNRDENFMSWKTKVLRFNETPFSKVIKDIEALYHSSFDITNQELLECKLTIEFDNEPLENVLEALQVLYGINYRLEGTNRYSIRGGTCS